MTDTDVNDDASMAAVIEDIEAQLALIAIALERIGEQLRRLIDAEVRDRGAPLRS